MATTTQIKNTEKQLRDYRKKYLRKEFSDVDESATRIMINSLLCDVLGYQELEEIKTEYRIRGTYADYVIQTNRKKQFIVEVKAIQLDLNEKHLRQSVNYAANEGVDWVMLTNGRAIELYKVLFEKPIRHVLIFSYDLSDLTTMKQAAEFMCYLTKKAVVKGELEDLWSRQCALAPEELAKILYSEEVIKLLRREIKKKTKIHFQTEDLQIALHDVVTNKIEATLKMKKTK
jgi:hypothetical protein